VLTFPSYVTVEQKEIPKQSTGLWQTIWNHNIKIVKSLQTNRFFVYDRHGEFLGELEGVEMFLLAIKLLDSIDAWRTEINKQVKGNIYHRYVLRTYKSMFGKRRWAGKFANT